MMIGSHKDVCETLGIEDMRLLATEVISCDLQRIVGIILKIPILKSALIKKLTDHPSGSYENGNRGQGQQTCTRDSSADTSDSESRAVVPTSDQLQSAFLRPHTPQNLDSADSHPPSPSPDPSCTSPPTHSNAPQSEPEAVRDSELADGDSAAGASRKQSGTRAVKDTGGVERAAAVPIHRTKKCKKLDQLLRQHAAQKSPPSEDTNKRHERHALCSQQVTHVVTNGSYGHPREDTSRQRKPKSYIPYQVVSPSKQISSRSGNIYTNTGERRSIATAPVAKTVETRGDEPTTSSVSVESVTTARPSSSQEPQLSLEGDGVNAVAPALLSAGPFIAGGTHMLAPYDNSDPQLNAATAYLSETMIPDFAHVMVSDPSLNSGLINDLGVMADPGTSLPLLTPGLRYSPTKSRWRHDKAAKFLGGKKSRSINPESMRDLDAQSNAGSTPLRLKCKRCGARFTSKADYQLHLQSNVCSTGFSRTHTCEFCGYCALTRQRLIVHQRTHNGERPHRCPFCSYAATQTAPLKRHIRNIHMKQPAVSLIKPQHGRVSSSSGPDLARLQSAPPATSASVQ